MNEELSKWQQSVEARLKKLVDEPPLAYHTHTGYDMNKVFFNDLDTKIMTIAWTLPGTSAATAANYGVFFIAPSKMVLQSVREVHQTAGTAGGTVTVDIEKLTGTQALGAGVSMLSTALSLKAAINTVQNGVLATTNSTLNLASGDRLALKDTGTLTSVANVTILLELSY